MVISSNVSSTLNAGLISIKCSNFPQDHTHGLVGTFNKPVEKLILLNCGTAHEIMIVAKGVSRYLCKVRHGREGTIKGLARLTLSDS